MAAGVDLKDHIVSARLDQLIALFDQVEQMKTEFDSMRDQQLGAWPAIGSVLGFVGRYRASLQMTADELASIQTTIGEFHQALLDSAQSLKNVDQDVKDRLQLLADRLASVPEPAPKPTTTSTASHGGWRDSSSPVASTPVAGGHAPKPA